MTTTFEKAKVGDKVWGVSRGWGEIRKIESDGNTYPLDVYFDKGESFSFNRAGKYLVGDKFQSLFWDEVKIVAPEQPKQVPPKDAKVLVWDTSGFKKNPRYSTGNLDTCGRLLCYDSGRTSWSDGDDGTATPWIHWELADESN